ncbi:MAG: thiamine phosphate synthase [Marinilabiliaceae bacterium]|nr:thiamine phosphate synthase [Marinilabiliaceae bacterium]
MKTIKKLHYITSGRNAPSIIDEVTQFLTGGGRWVQLRMKDTPINEIIETAKKLKTECKKFNATLIIDDHPEVCIASDANGVHLGKNDMPVLQARKLLGPNMLIGATANTINDIKKLSDLKVDYIGLGPYRFTTTKKDLSPIIGLEGYRLIIKQMRKEEIKIPVVAIGGIGLGDIPEILNTGVHGFAIATGIKQSGTASETTKAMLALINYHQQTLDTENLTQINIQ